MARVLITIPATAKRNAIIEIRALIQHPMETGYRRSSEGAMLARDLIRRFSCKFEESGNSKNDIIFSAKLFAAVAANPYLAFHTIASASGVFVFTWEGDNGFVQTERAVLTVT